MINNLAAAPSVSTPLMVVLTKIADLGTIPGHSIFEGYTAEGLATTLPEVGARFGLLRTRRNGLEIPGIFSTSPVVEVTKINDSRYTFTTRNSVYTLCLVPLSS